MTEPQPTLGYLLIIILIAAGTATILSARNIERVIRRWSEHELARMNDSNPFKFSLAFSLSINPALCVLNIRFSGALMILFALILLGLVIQANL